MFFWSQGDPYGKADRPKQEGNQQGDKNGRFPARPSIVSSPPNAHQVGHENHDPEDANGQLN